MLPAYADFQEPMRAAGIQNNTPHMQIIFTQKQPDRSTNALQSTEDEEVARKLRRCISILHRVRYLKYTRSGREEWARRQRESQ